MKKLCRVVPGYRASTQTAVVPMSAALLQEFADQHGIPFFETSAKDNQNVEQVYIACADLCPLLLIASTALGAGAHEL